VLLEDLASELPILREADLALLRYRRRCHLRRGWRVGEEWDGSKAQGLGVGK
jgi:hypothetical protein